MKKLTILITAIALTFAPEASAQFEDAATAVANMRIGWNAGNRLDSNSGNTSNMWLEAWSDRSPKAYETAWGQVQITRELIHMFKEAGFNAIRVPVTWYPHLGNVEVKVGPNENGDWVGTWDVATWSGTEIDPAWMARVHEVVDYVIHEGMYCILNVHHDTGESSTGWLRASEATYERQRERYEALWTAIATEFRDYGKRLIFEAYNEMLDDYGSWCFASFACPGNYNQSVATSAYKAINSYAQSFVNSVRATGGNNIERNLVVNTYGACSGEGNWNSHLTDPLREMQVPEDPSPGHIIFQVHSYPNISSVSAVKSTVDELISKLRTHLCAKGAPVIIGEWGLTTPDTNPKRKEIFCELGRYLTEATKANGMTAFLWMMASEGKDCEVPQWTEPELKDAIIKGYYGEEGYNAISAIEVYDDSDTPAYNLQGIRVDNPHAYRGLYISKGKKFIVR